MNFSHPVVSRQRNLHKLGFVFQFGINSNDLHRRVQNLLEDSSLNEGPRDRLYHRSGWGAVFGSSLLLFAIADSNVYQEISDSKSPFDLEWTVWN